MCVWDQEGGGRGEREVGREWGEREGGEGGREGEREIGREWGERKGGEGGREGGREGTTDSLYIHWISLSNLCSLGT